MLSKDATTIWERWEYETGYGMNSHNHPMYGSISAWFYKYLAGISAEAPGLPPLKSSRTCLRSFPLCAAAWKRVPGRDRLLLEPGDRRRGTAGGNPRGCHGGSLSADPGRTPRASTGTACRSGGGIPARFRMTPFGLSAGSRAIFTLPAGAGITGSGSTDIPQPK